MARPSLLRVAAFAAAGLTAYGAGAVTVVLTGSESRPPAPRTGVLDEAERQIQARAARPVSARTLERAAVQGMLAALDDKWAAYYGPTDYAHFQQVLAGTYSGVGVWVRRGGDGSLRVLSVQPASPAARAGLRPGDVVVRVGSTPVAHRPVAEVVSALRGPAGSQITMAVRRGGRQLNVGLVRTSIHEENVSRSMLTPNVAVLRVAAFTRGVGAWVRRQVAAARDAHLAGVVLDLRDNPGGLLTEAVETASVFLDGGPVVRYEQRGAAPQVLEALGRGDTGLPLVVLVDGGTASAAEIVAGALQDRGRAVLLGTQTFGKGSVQAPTRLSDGSALELTVGHYLTPKGHHVDGVGITPDVQVPVGVAPGTMRQRVVEVLSGLTADAGSRARG